MIRTSPERSKLEDVEADELRGLREQAAGDAGERGGDGVDRDQAAAHRRADRVHAQDVLADAGQRAPERRMHEHAREQPGEEQDHEAVAVGGAAEQVEAEAPKSGSTDAVQAVGAAGQPARLLASSSSSMKTIASVSISSVRPWCAG